MKKNRKATAIETSVLVISGALAAQLGIKLADHSVSIAAIVSVVMFTLTTGLYLASSLGQALRTSLFTCPTKGCAVSIRAKDATDTELARLKAYATDHSNHGGA